MKDGWHVLNDQKPEKAGIYMTRYAWDNRGFPAGYTDASSWCDPDGLRIVEPELWRPPQAADAKLVEEFENRLNNAGFSLLVQQP